jgi:hypothetical protein
MYRLVLCSDRGDEPFYFARFLKSLNDRSATVDRVLSPLATRLRRGFGKRNFVTFPADLRRSVAAEAIDIRTWTRVA